MRVYEAALSECVLQSLLAMSKDWAEENCTHGYCPNDREDIAGNRVFLAEENGKILGYLLGYEKTTENSSSVVPAGAKCFEVEELYVRPDFRSAGIGKKLFCFAQQQVKESGSAFLLLSTATKDYPKILHFYIDELGMDFWSARLFKKL